MKTKQPTELNKIYCWDCLEIMKEFSNWFIDLTVTSPPYDNLRTYNGFTWDFEWIAKELNRITKDWGVVVWIVWDATIKWSETGTSFKQALYFKEIGFNLHDTMIWNKNCFSAVWALQNRYAPVFEYMFILSKWFPKTFNPIKDRKNIYGGKKVNGTIRNKDGTMKKFSKEVIVNDFGQRYNIRLQIPHRQKWWHPAPFPENLAQDHILSWSNEWDLVFDPFLWSWTTAKLAKVNNRNYLWIDISQEYINIANKRIESLSQ